MKTMYIISSIVGNLRSIYNQILINISKIKKLFKPERIELVDRDLFIQLSKKLEPKGKFYCTICKKELSQNDLSAIFFIDHKAFFLCKDPNCIGIYKEEKK
jgi:hypothetical protein